ncbi:hypothetical protein FQA39_LY13982 [Lamprigera yunnana]|nr:hypothetical protein FQA39_LY13982 [Lamprigera yunnana]
MLTLGEKCDNVNVLTVSNKATVQSPSSSSAVKLNSGNMIGVRDSKFPSATEKVSADVGQKITWCTISNEEQQKCKNFAMALKETRSKSKERFSKWNVISKDECMVLLDEEKVTLTSLDAGEVFVGGRYYSLVPIAQEIAEGNINYHYAVAVVRLNTLSDVNHLRHLRGKKACFAGVGTMAGWVVPIHSLMNEGSMEIVDCNNHVKTATEFFGPSCAVNSLTDKYNPIGDNSDKLCRLCIGKVPGGKCTDSDPYAGFEGAFRCLLEVGEIAFLKHTTVEEQASSLEFSGVSKENFELLCKDGTRRPLNDYRVCNWGLVPGNAIVTTSASAYEVRRKYQKFLRTVAEMYSRFPNNGSHPMKDDTYYDNRDRDEYDQHENRVRYKRQNYDPQNDPYGNNNNMGSYDSDQNRDSFNRDAGRDPFVRDPHNINKNQYGVNVDPYSTDLNYNRNDETYRDNRINHTRTDYRPYGRPNISYYETFNIFESMPKYGTHANLLFQDTTINFAALSDSQQIYSEFLGDAHEIIMGIRQCPVDHMTLCVTSDPELEKCVKMRTALKAQLIKPEMRCEKAHSQINCMQKIQSGNADVAVFDASDVYTAGLNFNLIPFISEVYNLGEPEYYVVAVAKEEDPSTELSYLRGKNTCHGGMNSAAGWVYPLAYLISNGWIRSYGCNSIRAAAEYFTKSCIPGALSTEYNTGVPYDNLCDLCHGASFRYCRRDASEDYYGHTGAFRCLVEGGGHVAFVKHTTVMENTNGQRREWWARDNLMEDFELLCPDSTRAEVQDYRKCNLGKVKSNAIVTRGGDQYKEIEIHAFINLFMYSQTYYGRKTTDEFRDDELEDTIKNIVEEYNINMTTRVNILIGKDTRPSSPSLAKSVIDGVLALSGKPIDFGIVSTPQMHYFVKCRNTQNQYGVGTEEGYYTKLVSAFRKLRGDKFNNTNYVNRIFYDGANGVGAKKIKYFQERLGDCLKIELFNDAGIGTGKLNYLCGADYVKSQQSFPTGVTNEPNQRCASVDGDADRIVYYYNDDDNRFHLLDGDRIATLIASYLKELVSNTGLDLNLGLVQTAYANGASTDYITEKLKVPVACVSTGVKHLHHKALEYDIGIYFEANGHGTVTFSDAAKYKLKEATKNNMLSENQQEAAKKLLTVIDVVNETVGDAISDMLLVETILHDKGWNIEDWEQTYTDLPNKLLKVTVQDRNVITTKDAERQCVNPIGLQDQIDALVKKYNRGRSFVRSSGTEDIVRVYAEAATKEESNKLAAEVAQQVYELAGGKKTNATIAISSMENSSTDTREEADIDFDNSSSEDNISIHNAVTREWTPIAERSIVLFKYTQDEELLENDIDTNDPFSLYRLFLTDNIIQLIVDQTNTISN